jgi:hypothetical protein
MVMIDKIAIAEADLQADLRRNGVECTICELEPSTATVIVRANSVVDWLLAKHDLKEKGLTAVQPG